MIEGFVNWLQATSLSGTIRTAMWMIPAIQTVHILCIAIVMSSTAMLDLRLLQILHHPHSIGRMAKRFLPWVWGALCILLASGSLLVVAEPERELGSPAFRFKLIMIALVIPLTLALQLTLRRNEDFWSLSPGRRAGARALAVVSFLIWVSILAAGRWIAYYQAPT